LASLRENDANGRDNSVRAMEVKKIFEDSPLLPKPLSSNQLTESVSNGSRVRVAYQGVRGAYSESAAEKAYPNCEAVPCEEFDTAFEVRISFLY
jgi:arogenate/prephenate dehydratase